MLANIYLAGGNKEILVGTFIAGIKSIKETSAYPHEVTKGIELHQSVLEYTESDPSVIESKKRLNPKYSKYSASIIRFFYDHFLAANWDQFSSVSLEKFTMNSYRVLLEYQKMLPYKAKHLLPRMIRGNWLQKFVTMAGVHQVINQMDIKSTKLTYIVSAFEDLISEYKDFQYDFMNFFPRLVSHVNNQMEANERETKGVMSFR